MNTNFRSLWNASTGAWVAVAETTTARGKRSGSSVTTKAGVSGVLLAAALFGSAGPAFAGCVPNLNVYLCTGQSAASFILPAGTKLQNEGVIGTSGNGQIGVASNGAGVTVINSKTGSIVGGGIVQLSGDNSTFQNLGGYAFGDSLGVVLQGAGGSVINEQGGTIGSKGSYGIDLSGGGEVLNTGGSKILASDFFAIRSQGATTKITNESGSVIAANNIAIRTPGGTTLLNSGQINGHVFLFGATANNVRLFTDGQIDGVLSIEGAESVLTLDGASGTTGVYSKAVTGSTAFTGSFVKMGAGRWELDRALTPGSASVAEGTLSVGAAGSLGAGPLQLAPGATLELQGAKLANAISGKGALVVNGAATSKLSGDNTNFSGGVSLASSGLTLANASGFGSGDLTVSGPATLNWTSALSTLSNNVNLASGGNLTLQGNSKLAMLGAFSGDGLLTMNGSDTLTLMNASTNSGKVTVTAGTLAVNNSKGSATGTGAVEIGAAATLTGSGTISGQVDVAGGRLLVGSGIGTMNVGNLVLGKGSSLDFDLGEAGVAGGSKNDLLKVNGNLTLGGNLNIVQSAGGVFGAGLYRLIDYTGTLTDNGMTINKAPVAASHLYLQTSIANQVNLVNTNGLSLGMWDGDSKANYNDNKVSGGSGTWRVGSQADGWTDTNGSVNTAWVQDSVAIFGATAGVVTVDNTGSGGAVRVGGMQFTTDGYVVTGDALTITAGNTNFRVGDGSGTNAGMTATINSVITGAGGLQKDDVGTLVLTGANNYSGGTTVSAGVLQGNTTSLQGNIVNNATVAFEQGPVGSSGTFAGTMSGSGVLRKIGDGELVLASANTYRGGTSIDAGSLNVTASGALGTGPVAVNAGGFLAFSGSADASGVSITTAARNDALSINGGNVEFRDKSSAGNASFVLLAKSEVAFRGTANAAGASFENRGGQVTFEFNSDAGNARITNFKGGATNIWDDASAGHATITNETGGQFELQFQGTAGQATVVNNAGGRVRIDRLAVAGASIGALSGAGDVVIGTKVLTTGGLNTDTEISGVISGVRGSLVKEGTGALTLSGANTYTGGTALKQGRLNLGSNAALGTGALAMDDGTTLGFSAGGLTISNAIQLTGKNDPVIDTGAYSGTLAGVISGGGFITKQGTGTLTLSGANTYTGATNVAQGTLKAGAVNTLSAVSAHSVAAGATLDIAGFNQSVASLSNSGTVSLAGTAPGTTLTVNGNYVGNGGVLRLGAALGATGLSDRLVVNGGTATGKTSIQLVNLGGLGARTVGNGIEVVTAQGGATTTAQTTKDAFSLAGTSVAAGAFEYRLYAADAAGAGENWYLRGDVPAVAAPAVPGAAGPAFKVPAYRPEASLYAALPQQLRQSNLSMLGNLRLRVGDDDVKGSAPGTSSTSGTPGADRRAWGRLITTDLDIQQGGTVSPTSKGHVSGFQAGTDLLAASNWRAGIYVGQLDGDAKVSGFASGIANLSVGRNDLRNQYLGAYGTYTTDGGFYADAVVQAGRHRSSVAPLLGYGGAQNKGSSVLASVEVGQAFALGGSGWAIEPQLQLIHQHLRLDDAQIVGAAVVNRADSGWIARAGVRIKGQLDTGVGALQPYARLNVYKASSGTDVARFVNPAAITDISARTGGTSTEAAGGFTLALSERTSIYSEIGKLWASGGNTRVKSSINGSVGVRVKW